MVADGDVVKDFAERGSIPQCAVFVASGAERIAQLFTGIVGRDERRVADVELVIECLDRLWEPGADDLSIWSDRAERLAGLPEFDGDLEPAGIAAYAYDAAAVLLYAVSFRMTKDRVNIDYCCNHLVNSAGFISDELADGVDRVELERSRQEQDIRDILSVSDSTTNEGIIAIRERSRQASRHMLGELTDTDIAGG